MKYNLLTLLNGERRISVMQNQESKNGVEFEPSDLEIYYSWSDDGTIYLDEERKARIERDKEIKRLKKRLAELGEDMIQNLVGEAVLEFETRKAEFRDIHNQLREIQGKEKRLVKEDY
jgi:hypothetical protein